MMESDGIAALDLMMFLKKMAGQIQMLAQIPQRKRQLIQFSFQGSFIWSWHGHLRTIDLWMLNPPVKR